MPNLVSIRKVCDRETVAVLRHLLEQAEAGDIRGVAVMAKLRNNRQKPYFTGDFQRDKDAAALAALRLSVEITQSA
jgi:predicted 2-oxoglutarate/Fe(II)-dependent dioxygenase YbiX